MNSATAFAVVEIEAGAASATLCPDRSSAISYAIDSARKCARATSEEVSTPLQSRDEYSEGDYRVIVTPAPSQSRWG